MPSEAVDHVSLSAVEERVKCEIGSAFRKLRDDQTKRFPDLHRWVAGLTLSLSVDSTGGVTPSTSLTGPFGSISPLDLSVGASLNAKRTALVNVFIAFIEAAEHHCPPPSAMLIEGHLGLDDWIVRVFEARYPDDQKRRANSDFEVKNDKSIGYTVDFLITLGAGATPNFIIPNATGSKAAIGFEAKSTHSVDIAMVEMSQAEFDKRFKTVVVEHGRYVDAPNPLADPNYKGARPMGTTAENVPKTIKKWQPPKTRPGSGQIDLETKLRLEDVLRQLNNKALLQSLRR